MGGRASAGAFESAFFGVLVEVLAMLHRFWHGAAAVLFFLIMLAGSRADDTPQLLPERADIDREAIERLIDQLDELGFAQRQEASQKLSELGEAAIPHLEKVAAKGSRESSGRALDLLKRQLQEGSTTGKQSARESLERLSQSKYAATAQRARNVLSPPQPIGLQVFGGMPAFGPFPRGNGNNVVTRTVVAHEFNGRRQIEVKEQDTTIKMQTLPGGRIEVEIIERQNGRDMTRSITARDAEDLKQKDAEAGKLYEQYQPAKLQGIAGLPPPFPLPFRRTGR
jgi:hypothetical protein